MKTIYLLEGIIVSIGIILMGLLTKISFGVLEAREITDEFMKYEPVCYMLGGLLFFVGIVCFLLIIGEKSSKTEEV